MERSETHQDQPHIPQLAAVGDEAGLPAAAIHQLLDSIEARHGVRIVYACESGSRAWGFASPDSDYDIRFLFIRPRHAYLSLHAGTESIDLPLEGELDAGGWDIRKALRLLEKSNGALLEWLHSPIVYRAAPGFLERWRIAAAAAFSPRHTCSHYRGLAKQMQLGNLDSPAVRAKDYLYALRALLAASWVAAGKGIPPVPFAELVASVPEELRALISALLEHKARTTEGDLMPRVAGLDQFIRQRVDELALAMENMPAAPANPGGLDRFFRGELALPAPELPQTAEDFTLERIRRPDLLLFDAVAGSRAYGTAVAGSDEDRRGVFVAPRSFGAGLTPLEQVADEKSNEVYYEIGHYIALLLKNNPNALELLAMPDDCVLYRHPMFELLKPELFLSKLCARTFGEYAMGQIRKARGLNKKIVNPQPEQRRALLDFCHVPAGQGSVPVLAWLAARGLDPKHCGLTAVQHTAGIYALYHNPACAYRGLTSPKDPDAIVFSSVPKDAEPLTWMHLNQDAFKAHCKAHREYWDWVAQRNEERYRTNVEHGRGYDSKNLMHTLRLLDMAGEIATEGVLRIRRPNREFLLRVRNGEFSYDELVTRAEQQLVAVQAAFATAALPAEPDRQLATRLLAAIREELAG